MYVNMESLVNAIVSRVRTKCREVGINQGAIGISIVPQSEEARKWAFVSTNDVSLDTIVPVIEGKDTLIEFDGKIVGDTTGIVGMKIAAAKRVMKEHRKNGTEPTCRKECTSGALPEEFASLDGLVNWRGGVTIPLLRHDVSQKPVVNVEVMTIYVAVSGGTEDQDEEAAWEALNVVYTATAMEDYYFVPSYCTK